MLCYMLQTNLHKKTCNCTFWYKLEYVKSAKLYLIGAKVGAIASILQCRAGRYTGSYRIPVFIFLTIWIFKIPQYRCHLNNVRNTTPLERGLFSLLHFGEETAVCVTKRESSETEALVECDERSHPQYPHRPPQIHRPLHQLPRLSHNSSPSIRWTPINFRVPAFLNSLFITLRP